MYKHQKRYAQLMEIMGYSQRTITSYGLSLAQVFKFTKKDPDKIKIKDIQDFLIFKQNQKLAASSLRIFCCAIRLYYKHVIKKNSWLAIHPV